MNVLFFCHDDFACNSAGHIAGFAAGLRDLGHHCAVAIPGDSLASAGAWGDDPPFRPAIFADAWERPGELFPDGRPPDLLHAWTPREHVRRAVEHARRSLPAARLVVQLEDNEDHLTARFLGVDDTALGKLTDAELATRLPAHLSHPREFRRFLRTADAVTGIVAALADFVPRGVPFTEVWPGVDFLRYHPGEPDAGLRSSLGLRDGERVICYPGSSHFANGIEMASLYEAVFALNRGGTPCRLLRTGHDTPEFIARFAAEDRAQSVLHLGYVDRARLPALLRLADVLVQPGADDAFNRYRLPSKLPEFMATGRPVLLPRANVGRRVRAGKEALILEIGGAGEIAAGCQRVFNDPALGQRLGAGAAAFARRHFDPHVQAAILARVYERLRPSWWRRLTIAATRPPRRFRRSLSRGSW